MNNPTLARDLSQAAGVRAVGTTDEVTACELCGKSGLASTVIIEFTGTEGDHDGEAYLGSDCAARAVAGRTDRKLAGKILQQAHEDAVQVVKTTSPAAVATAQRDKWLG